MSFQLRKFKKVNIQDFDIKEDLSDIYIFKQKAPYVGIKFRSLDIKKYGFKINSVQVKLCSPKYLLQQVDSHKQFLQQWIKFRVDFKYRLYSQYFYSNKEKFADKMEQYVKKQQGQFAKLNSFQMQLNHLNKSLIKALRQHLKFDKQTLTLYPQLQDWLQEQYPIKQLFLVKKNKRKTQYLQTGNLKVQMMFNPINLIKNSLIFQTLSFESENKKKVQNFVENTQKQWKFNCYQKQNIQRQMKQLKFQFNISYPQLLQDIYNEYGSS